MGNRLSNDPYRQTNGDSQLRWADGSYLAASLLQASNRSLFGGTEGGGTGRFFELSPRGQQRNATVLHTAEVSYSIEISRWIPKAKSPGLSPSELPVKLWRTVTFREHDKQVYCDEERDMHVGSMLFCLRDP